MSTEQPKSPAVDVGLILILGVGILVRLPYIDAPFIRLEEWGMGQWSVFAANFHRFGYLESGFFPLFGKVGDQLIPYANHPPLGAVFLGLWTSLVGNSEVAPRLLSILFLSGTAAVIYSLAKEHFGRKAALWAAGVYSLMPISVYMGHFYTIEIAETFFSLLSIDFIVRWRNGGGWKYYLLTLAAMGLGFGSDYYTFLLCVPCALMAFYDRGFGKARTASWLALAAFVPVVMGLEILYLSWWDWAEYLTSGASKYSNPWHYWISPAYYWGIAKRLILQSGVVPVLAAMVGLVGAKGWNRRQLQFMMFLVTIPILDMFVTSRAVSGHNYRVIHFLAPLAVLAGVALAKANRRVLAALIVLFAVCSYQPLKTLYQPIQESDLDMAFQIRDLTTDKDILIGLPPHMAYYVGNPAYVPYSFLWKNTELYQNPKELYVLLTPFAEKSGYERIVLFQQFMLPPNSPKVDWSKTFDGVSNLKRKTRPGVDPQVWEFVEP
jgi:Dolichyl-phosphate-mannose-protein mannosyltransferase